MKLIISYVIFVLALILFSMFGWFFNLLNAIEALGHNPMTTLDILRVIGIAVAPIGVWLGWFA